MCPSITQTMRQLIFRLNLQQYRNIKYKKKEHQPDPLASEIIDLEDDGSPIEYDFWKSVLTLLSRWHLC